MYTTSAPVAEYMRRRQPDRGASASGRVHSAGAIRVKSAAPMNEYCVPAPAVIAATATLDKYVAQHWSRSRRKHHGRVSCGSASPCTMDFCENVNQWSEMPIRHVAANSETIILASVSTRAQVTRTAGWRVGLGSLPLMPRVSWTSNQVRRRWLPIRLTAVVDSMFDAFPARKAVVKLRLINSSLGISFVPGLDLIGHWVHATSSWSHN